jgi:hypothetical protein
MVPLPLWSLHNTPPKKKKKNGSFECCILTVESVGRRERSRNDPSNCHNARLKDKKLFSVLCLLTKTLLKVQSHVLCDGLDLDFGECRGSAYKLKGSILVVVMCVIVHGLSK